MTGNVNEEVRDDLVENDVAVRRVDGDIRNKIERRLDELGRDLKVLSLTIDPHGATRRDVRERRLEKLLKQANVVIDEAYREMRAILKGALFDVSRAEAQAVVNSISKQIPDEILDRIQ